jgi:hypothetical protein
MSEKTTMCAINLCGEEREGYTQINKHVHLVRTLRCAFLLRDWVWVNSLSVYCSKRWDPKEDLQVREGELRETSKKIRLKNEERGDKLLDNKKRQSNLV